MPYHFGERQAGESKLDTKAAWDYLVLLLDKTVGRYVPTRFVIFSAVGAAGVAVHMPVLTMRCSRLACRPSCGRRRWAALVAMTFNFALNNVLTYRDRRLRGIALAGRLGRPSSLPAAWARPPMSASRSICSSTIEFWAVSALAGIVVGAVWNYAVTAVYTWQRALSRRHRSARPAGDAIPAGR